MPRGIAVLRDFSGGINTQFNPRDIQDNQLGYAQDIMGDRVGSVRTMGNGSGTPRQVNNSASVKSINTLASTDLASSAGYGFKHFELDWTEGGGNTGEHYLAVVDESGELNLWDYTNNSWATVSVDIHGSETDCKPIITPINNGIRVADTNLTNSSTIKYYMYVKRSQLGRDRSGFYAGNNTLPAPTAGNLVGSATYTDGSVNFQIDSQTAGTGTWSKDNYSFAYTFVYDGNQESAPYIVSSALALANVEDDRPWKVTVYAANATAATDYDARITGARIYWKYYDSGLSKIAQGEWNLLVDVDLTGTSSDEHAYGIRSKLGDKFANWTVSSNDANAVIVIQDPPIDTYATLNGYRSSDGALVIGNASDGYKSAIFTNRRMFVANVKMTGTDGEQVQEADRIMYSPVNKPDIFPASQFIDVVKGDAEPYIKLEAVGDRLFAFKGDNLFIINISNPSPAGWYLEATHRGMGALHPAAVFKADFGLIWVNPNGLFVYQEGGGVAELSEGKVLNGYGTDDYGFKAWGKLITAHSIVGYSQKDKEIIVNIDCSSVVSDSTFGGNGPDVVVYDMETQSFWFGKNRLYAASEASTGGGIASNFEYDWNGDLIYASEYSDTVTIRSWQSDSQTSTGVLFTTKDIDFGNPSKKKKIYDIYITYKHSDSNTVSNFLSYSTNGGTSFVTVDGDSSTAIANNTLDQATSWEIHKFTFTTPVECQSITLRFNGPTSNASKININDISIEYRELYGRVPAT